MIRTLMTGKVLLALALVALMTTGLGCQKKEKPLNVGNTLEPLDELPGGAGIEDSTPGEGLPDLDIDSLFFGETGLRPVYFDFDSYELNYDALATLRENAEKIKQVPGAVIQIEGHCDERGTQEYNLALGERRALAVREYLMNLGVSRDRLITISYGEEDPADPGHTEQAWAKNRRCEFNKAV